MQRHWSSHTQRAAPPLQTLAHLLRLQTNPRCTSWDEHAPKLLALDTHVQAVAHCMTGPLCVLQFSGEFRRACDAQLRQLHTALKGCAGTTQPISNFSMFVRVPSSFDAGELCLQRVAFRAGDDSAGDRGAVLCVPVCSVMTHMHATVKASSSDSS